MPAPQTQYVSLPGRDDVLDMSVWAGALRYNSRAISIVLLDMEGNNDKLLAQVYGKRVHVFTDTDTDYYFDGRCDAAQVQYKQHGAWDITLGFTCNPYKMRQLPTTVSITTTAASTTVTLKAERKPVVPVITASGSCTITVGNTAHSCTSGTFQLPDLLLTDVAQNVVIGGSGVTVGFTWTDGRF